MIQYLQKLIYTFYKDHLEKQTATSPLVDIILPIAKLVVKPITKPKLDQLAKNIGTNKCAKRN